MDGIAILLLPMAIVIACYALLIYMIRLRQEHAGEVGPLPPLPSCDPHVACCADACCNCRDTFWECMRLRSAVLLRPMAIKQVMRRQKDEMYTDMSGFCAAGGAVSHGQGGSARDGWLHRGDLGHDIRRGSRRLHPVLVTACDYQHGEALDDVETKGQLRCKE